VKRPRVYRSETKCRAAAARYIESAEELLDQAVGVRNRVAAMARNKDMLSAFLAESEWEKQVRRCFKTAREGMMRYLQDQLGGFAPVLALGLPPDTGKPRHRVGLDNGEPWLKKALEELQEVQAALGIKTWRGHESACPCPIRGVARFRPGRQKVINDHAKDMRSPRTPKQLYDAIGSAKELTEATLRAALERLGESYRPGTIFPGLMKKWRTAIGKVAPPDPQGETTLDRAQAALANLVTFLAEWRNAYGRGHGRPHYPPDLTARHAASRPTPLRHACGSSSPRWTTSSYSLREFQTPAPSDHSVAVPTEGDSLGFERARGAGRPKSFLPVRDVEEDGRHCFEVRRAEEVVARR
jgi:hypothetical protein